MGRDQGQREGRGDLPESWEGWEELSRESVWLGNRLGCTLVPGEDESWEGPWGGVSLIFGVRNGTRCPGRNGGPGINRRRIETEPV